MVAVTAPAPVVRARGPRIEVATTGPRLGRPAMPAVLPGGHRDELVVVEAVTERPLAMLRGAVVDSMSWVLNAVGQLGWSMSSWDPVLLDCLVDPQSIRETLDGRTGTLRLLGREVQWYRDGVLRWSGVPVSADVDLAGTVAFGAYDLGWYLTRRFFGAAERHDLLEGAGSMDTAGLPGWRRNALTADRDTDTKARGIGSARLSGTGTLVRSFVHPTTTLSVEIAVHLTWHAKIPTGTPVGTPIATIEVREDPDGPVLDASTVRVTEETRLGVFDQADTYAMLPPGRPHTVTVRLHSLAGLGDWWFDDVRTLKNDTTGIPVPGGDLATHAIAAMNHFQHGRGKGSFGLKPYKVSNSGTVEPMGVRHIEHQQALDYLGTLTGRADGIDWWIDERRRRFCVGKRRGVDHRHIQFHSRNIASGGWSTDEQGRNSAVVVIGEGDGADRPEGGYTDTSKVGGLVLEEAVTPPAGTPLAALDPMAKQTWQQTSDPQVGPSPMTVSDDLLGDLGPGDRVPTELRSGVLRAEPLMRLQTVTLRPSAGRVEVA